MASETLITRTAPGTVAATVASLEEAVAAAGYSVLGSHDLRAKLQGKGIDFERDCVVLEVCNPHRAAAVLDADMGVSSALPCRVSVYEEEGRTRVSTLRPEVLIGIFGGDEALGNEASAVATDLAGILDAVAED